LQARRGELKKMQKKKKERKKEKKKGEDARSSANL